MFRTILVTTDLSEESWAALAPAVKLTEMFHADLHVLAVLEDSFGDLASLYQGAGASTALEEHVSELQTHAEDALETKLSDLRLRLPVHSHLQRSPSPKRAILDFIKEKDIDLVVMATHGRAGVRRLLIGSTTESVVRGSEVPVLTIPLGEEFKRSDGP